MSSVDWKAEAELLRAQLVQCTIAMREVASALYDEYGYVPDCWLVNLADTLNDARGNLVDHIKCTGCQDLEKQCNDQAETIGSLLNTRTQAQTQAHEWATHYRKKCLEMLTLDGRNTELANEVTRLRRYKKRFVALAVALDEEPEA